MVGFCVSSEVEAALDDLNDVVDGEDLLPFERKIGVIGIVGVKRIGIRFEVLVDHLLDDDAVLSSDEDEVAPIVTYYSTLRQR